MKVAPDTYVGVELERDQSRSSYTLGKSNDYAMRRVERMVPAVELSGEEFLVQKIHVCGAKGIVLVFL